jgi:hypothetical protein
MNWQNILALCKILRPSQTEASRVPSGSSERKINCHLILCKNQVCRKNKRANYKKPEASAPCVCCLDGWRKSYSVAAIIFPAVFTVMVRASSA